MARQVRVAPAEEVPEGATVRHYDELTEPAKVRLAAVAGERGATEAGDPLASTAEDCDLVKFTDYYRIERI